ncbi:hypothetical protein AAMO2058_001437000, partial [Amorphochlora amoebiformis]
LGGAIKNVVALAAGIADGLKLGLNARSGIVTRGLGEMRRLFYVLGGKQSTLTGLAGVGDTLCTCFGPKSRNRQAGERLGKGETLEEILATSSQVSEGVPTAKALARLIRERDTSFRTDLKYPIIFGVEAILNEEKTATESFKDVMSDPLSMELYELPEPRLYERTTPSPLSHVPHVPHVQSEDSMHMENQQDVNAGSTTRSDREEIPRISQQ